MRRALLVAGWCAVLSLTSLLSVNGSRLAAQEVVLRQIGLEVSIIQLRTDAKEEFAARLCGPSEEVAAALRELQSKGHVTLIDRVRLTTLENHPTMIQSGRSESIVVGQQQSFGGRGGSTQQLQQQQTGTMISATARSVGNAVLVELQVEKSQIIPAAPTEEGDAPTFPRPETLTCQVTTRINSGETVIAGGLETRTGGVSESQLILASATLLGEFPGDAPEEAARTELRIFHLRYAAAAEVAEVLQVLLSDQETLALSIDERTNSVIVRGSSEQLEVVSALLTKLDEAGAKDEPARR